MTNHVATQESENPSSLMSRGVHVIMGAMAHAIARVADGDPETIIAEHYDVLQELAAPIDERLRRQYATEMNSA